MYCGPYAQIAMFKLLSIGYIECHNVKHEILPKGEPIYMLHVFFFFLSDDITHYDRSEKRVKNNF